MVERFDSNDTDLALEREMSRKELSAYIRREHFNAVRISIWALLGIVGGAVAGTAVDGPVGMVVGGMAGGLGGRKLGEALVRSEDKKRR